MRERKKVRKSTDNKNNLKIIIVLSVIAILSFVCITVLNKKEVNSEVNSYKNDVINVLDIFDNKVTKESYFLYQEENKDRSFVIHTKLAKENAEKKVYDLEVYNKEKETPLTKDMQVVVEKDKVKIGETVIYKNNLEDGEVYTTKLAKAKNKKATVSLVRENSLEIVVMLKYTDAKDVEIEEEITLEKERGIVRIVKRNVKEDKTVCTDLVKTYYKLENIKIENLLEDYLAE